MSACDRHAVQVKATASSCAKQLVDGALGRGYSNGAVSFNGTTLVQRRHLLGMAVDAASRARGDAKALLV